MTDVLLFHTPDNGDINITNGQVETTGSFETAAYVSLFGGNVEDDGSQNNPRNWWGNLSEQQPSAQYRSRTQHLLGSIPPTSGNLRRLEEAARADLSWLLDLSIANELDVTARLFNRSLVCFNIVIRAEGLESQFEFTENWEASQ